MKLELLDPYNIRARLCASMILLAPIAITAFFCFHEVFSFASSTLVAAILLAFTNYVPIMQRLVQRRRKSLGNYAARFLSVSDTTLDAVTKQRYYTKLCTLDPSFSKFSSPDNSQDFSDSCSSAVRYLRERTRDNHLLLEENINYGFCKNLYLNKRTALILCLVCNVIIAVYSLARYHALAAIPLESYFAFCLNCVLFLFWIFGITKEMMDDAATRYAMALLSTLDSLPS